MENIALQSLQIFSLLLRAEIATISVRNTIMRKFANFVRLYFPHITTFFNQILGFYYFLKVLFGNVVFLVGIWLEQKFVYKENCLLRPVFPQPYRIIVSTQKKILRYVMIRLVFCFVKQMKTTVNF